MEDKGYFAWGQSEQKEKNVSSFVKGDRVIHKPTKRRGTYVKLNLSGTHANVLFDGQIREDAVYVYNLVKVEPNNPFQKGQHVQDNIKERNGFVTEVVSDTHVMVRLDDKNDDILYHVGNLKPLEEEKPEKSSLDTAIEVTEKYRDELKDRFREIDNERTKVCRELEQIEGALSLLRSKK